MTFKRSLVANQIKKKEKQKVVSLIFKLLLNFCESHKINISEIKLNNPYTGYQMREMDSDISKMYSSGSDFEAAEEEEI